MIETFITWWRDRQHLFGAIRSPDWPRVRREHLKEHPTCEVCGTTKNLEVHHLIPVHRKPEMELDPENLMTLCRTHHFEWGHLFSWFSYNLTAPIDVNNFRIKVENRP